MRIWLSKNSTASLRDQLATQFMLGIIGEDLKAGDKLPSIRELAIRHHIHANTASAAYRLLESRGWVEFRKGSGVFVGNLARTLADPEIAPLDGLIERFLAGARAHGFSLNDVHSRLNHWFDKAPIRRIVVMEPEPELCGILISEIRGHVDLPVEGLVLSEAPDAGELSGAAVVALISRARQLRAALPAGTPHLFLRLRSVPDSMHGQQRPQAGARIAVASASPEILRQVRTILAAAAMDPALVEFRDAREDGWLTGLNRCEFTIADVVTAGKIPGSCAKRVIRVVSDGSLEELRQFVNLVTDQKVPQSR